MATTRRPLAEQQAAIKTADALALAIRLHEQKMAAEEEAIIRSRMGAREQARSYRAPMREQGMSDPRIVQGLAQSAPLHRQDPRLYREQPAPVLTPAQQEALDAQHDYNADWISRDEAGRPHLNRRPMSETLGIDAPSAERDRNLAAMEAQRYAPKPTKPVKPPRRTI